MPAREFLKRSPSPGRGRDDWVTVEPAHHAQPSCEAAVEDRQEETHGPVPARASVSRSLSATEEINLLVNVLFYLWLKRVTSWFKKYKTYCIYLFWCHVKENNQWFNFPVRRCFQSNVLYRTVSNLQYHCVHTWTQQPNWAALVKANTQRSRNTTSEE